MSLSRHAVNIVIFCYTVIQNSCGAILAEYSAREALMADFSHSELASDLTTNTRDTLRNVANTAANVLCGIYEQYPTGILPSVGSTPISNIATSLLDNLCAPRNLLPPANTVPFTGGQCACVSYNISYNVVVNGVPSGPNSATLEGPISTYRDVDTSSGTALAVFGFIAGTPQCNGPRKVGAIGNVNPRTSSLTVISVTRVDGNPDNCGSPPARPIQDYPPPNSYTVNAPVTIGGNTVNAPVTIIPTVFAPVGIFRPEFNVDVGGINVNFNLGGVDFTLKPELNVSVNLPGNYPPGAKPPAIAPRDPVSETCDLTEVIDLLEDVKECACPPQFNNLTTSYGAAVGRAISLPNLTQSVVLTISTLNTSVRSQVGEGNAPDVWFLGWYAFGGSDGLGERIPISYLENEFLAPENAKEFAYSLNFQSQAALTVRYKQKAA